MNLFLNDNGTLTRKDNTLFFHNEKTKKDEYLPIAEISSIFIMASISLDSSAISLCHQHSINIYFFDLEDSYAALVANNTSCQGATLENQVLAYQGSKRLNIAKEIVMTTAYNMQQVMSYYEKANLTLKIDYIESLLSKIKSIADIKHLMNLESLIWKEYYSCFTKIIGLPSSFTRKQKDPDDFLNASLNYLNAILYRETLTQILNAGLNPSISYLHSTNERPFSLQYDLAEMYKPLLVERTLFTLLNRDQIRLVTPKEESDKPILLGSIRRLLVKEFMKRYRSKVKIRKSSYSYSDLLLKDCYSLRNYINGKSSKVHFRRTRW
jgi:CRISPR-associated protein Cas1